MAEENGAGWGSLIRGAGAVARPRTLLGGALAIGFVCEALLHAQPPGLGYALAALAAALLWWVLGRSLGVRVSKAGLALLALIVFFSAMVAVRASPPLQMLNLMAGIGLALLMAAIYVPGALGQMSFMGYAVGVFLSGLALVVQPFLLFFGDLPRAPRGGGRNRAAPLLWGAALALPFLILFGVLFAAADAVFAGYVRTLFSWLTDFPHLLARLVLSLMLAWLALGLARYAFTAEASGADPARLVKLDFLRLGGPAAITALTLVNVLFVAFVAVQAVYLFGGAETLARSGLSHSEYARRGFFELVTAAALVMALVLLADWLTRFAERRARQAIALLNALLVLLTLIILASALLRMSLYTKEYGLTQLRFYTTAFMFWLAVALVWLVATVLVSRRSIAPQGRRHFAFGALVTALATLTVLNLANPDALIARVNLERAIAGVGQPLDSAYLTQNLGADAVPASLAALPRLPDAILRASLACGLLEEEKLLDQQAIRLTWRGENLGNITARRALAAAHSGLAQTPCPK